MPNTSIFSVDTSCCSNTTVIDLAFHEEIPTITAADIKMKIKNKFSKNKAPKFDPTADQPFEKSAKYSNLSYQLSKICNACHQAQILSYSLEGSISRKPPSEISSYRPISLLPTLSKLLEKLLLNRLNPIIARDNLMPSYHRTISLLPLPPLTA